jgi:hypothetical protein
LPSLLLLTTPAMSTRRRSSESCSLCSCHNKTQSVQLSQCHVYHQKPPFRQSSGLTSLTVLSGAVDGAELVFASALHCLTCLPLFTPHHLQGHEA